MLHEILDELDETPTSKAIKPKPIRNEYSLMSRKLAAKDYMKNFTPPAKKVLITKSSQNLTTVKPPKILKEVHNNTNNTDDISSNIIQTDTKTDETQIVDKETQEGSIYNVTQETDYVNTQLSENLTIESFTQDDCFNDDIDMTQIEEFESQPQDTSVTEENVTDALQTEILSEWENFSNENYQIEVDGLDKSDIPLIEVEGKKVSLILGL